jgi:flagellar hook-associated protein 2
MVSSIYSYYLSQYGRKAYSKYDTHSRAQLKSSYNKVLKINSQTPAYKVDISDDALKYAIDLKENARELSHIADELSDEDTDNIAFKRSAVSDDPSVVDALYVGDNSSGSTAALEISVSQLAANQINTGNFLQPNSRLFEPGDYSFDLHINDLTYEFEFNVNDTETTEDIQNKISRLINRSNIGLNSQILTDNLGNTAISIASDSTGVTAMRPTIFNIKTNSLSSDDTAELVSTLGLDRVTQYPSNAVFSVNGTERTSASNDVVIDKSYALSFLNTTDGKPVTVSLTADTDAIADSIDELISGYNQLVSVTADDNNDKFEGNQKLKKEFAGIAKSYNSLLNDNGLNVTDNGTISVDRSAIVSAVGDGTLSSVFSSLNSFKQAIAQKAEDISLDPMNYVNNKIIAYKNPLRTTNDPYNISAYTGMMFDGYL